MLLRNTFSNTKKFFSKTFQNFKSIVSGGGYRKLPKTPPFNYDDDHQHQYLKTHHQNSKEFDSFYTEFSNRWEGQSAEHGHHHHHNDNPIKTENKKKSALVMAQHHQKEYSNHDHDEEEVYKESSFMKFSNQNSFRTEDDIKMKVAKISHGSIGRNQGDNKYDEENQKIREVRCKLVKQKMRELVMMDMKNMEHVMDVEEMIHYYSRLTCPVYLDIIDKFFTELYSEFFLINQPSSSTNNII